MIRLRTPSGNRNVIPRGILTPTGPKKIARLSILTDGGDVTFWDIDEHPDLGGVSVSASPLVQGGVAVLGDATIETESAFASAPSGIAPITWLWEAVSAGSEWTINTPTASSTWFRCAGVPSFSTNTASFKVTGTDARGATGEAEVTAHVTNYGRPY